MSKEQKRLSSLYKQAQTIDQFQIGMTVKVTKGHYKGRIGTVTSFDYNDDLIFIDSDGEELYFYPEDFQIIN